MGKLKKKKCTAAPLSIKRKMEETVKVNLPVSMVVKNCCILLVRDEVIEPGWKKEGDRYVFRDNANDPLPPPKKKKKNKKKKKKRDSENSEKPAPLKLEVEEFEMPKPTPDLPYGITSTMSKFKIQLAADAIEPGWKREGNDLVYYDNAYYSIPIKPKEDETEYETETDFDSDTDFDDIFVPICVTKKRSSDLPLERKHENVKENEPPKKKMRLESRTSEKINDKENSSISSETPQQEKTYPKNNDNLPNIPSNLFEVRKFSNCEVRLKRCDNLLEKYKRGKMKQKTSNEPVEESPKPDSSENFDKDLPVTQQECTNLQVKTQPAAIKPFKCNKCEKGFWAEGSYLSHIQIHKSKRALGLKPYKCDRCKKSFFRESVLGRHMVRRHKTKLKKKKSKKSEVSKIEKETSDEKKVDNSVKVQENIQEHQKVEIPDPWPCAVKLKRFDHPNEMELSLLCSQQMQVEESEREKIQDDNIIPVSPNEKDYKYPFIHEIDLESPSFQHFLLNPDSCELVEEKDDDGAIGNEDDYLLGTCSVLESHSNPDNKILKFECLACNKRCFSHAGAFLKHMRVFHRGSKLWHKCLECDKEFRYCRTLISHMNYHTGEKPYKCYRCNKSYAQTTGLVSHINYKHKPRKQVVFGSRKPWTKKTKKLAKPKVQANSTAIVTSGLEIKAKIFQKKRTDSNKPFNFYEQARDFLLKNFKENDGQTFLATSLLPLK